MVLFANRIDLKYFFKFNNAIELAPFDKTRVFILLFKILRKVSYQY